MSSGKDAEQFARRYLEQQGLSFVEQNVRYPFGELDLVMKQHGTWVFVEVKYRTGRGFGGALQALTAAQQQRIRKAASCYLQQHDISDACRFDVIAIDGDQVNWLIAAF
ncbi:YraN family protein [Shewanella sp. YIC-542]|uniref:YraN family protein n=1 Tax=Shewanella mytili TaxID=3377111 RepID=UPI00398E432B